MYKHKLSFIAKAALTGLILSGLLGGCSANNESPDEQKTLEEEKHVFQAEVQEAEDNRVLVKPLLDTSESRASDSISIPASSLEEGYEPKVGDLLEIEYTGGIAETYPAQLDNIISVKQVDAKN